MSKKNNTGRIRKRETKRRQTKDKRKTTTGRQNQSHWHSEKRRSHARSTLLVTFLGPHCPLLVKCTQYTLSSYYERRRSWNINKNWEILHEHSMVDYQDYQRPSNEHPMSMEGGLPCVRLPFPEECVHTQMRRTLH